MRLNLAGTQPPGEENEEKYFGFFSSCRSAFGCACAINVTLYGLLDGGVEVRHVNSGHGVKSLTTPRFANGVLEANRVGIKGSEDLGAGNSVNFILEQGFKLGNGQVDRDNPGTHDAFSRQATLSVSGRWGEIGAGRMGGLSSGDGSYSWLDSSVMGKSFYEAGLTSVLTTTPFEDNAVVYVAPNLSDFQMTALYSNGMYNEDAQKWSKNIHTYGVGTRYIGDKFRGTFIWEMIDWSGNYRTVNSAGDLTEKARATQLFNLSATYDFGSFKVTGGYEYALHSRSLPDFSDTTAVFGRSDGFGKKGFDHHSFSISTAVNVGAGKLSAAVNYMFGKWNDASDLALRNELSSSKFRRLAGGLAYEYPLSKRTTLYGFGAISKGFKAAKKNLVSNDLDLKYNTWSAGFGMRHRF